MYNTQLFDHQNAYAFQMSALWEPFLLYQNSIVFYALLCHLKVLYIQNNNKLSFP